MNGQVCCILGVCCPPNSAAQVSALAKELSADCAVAPGDAERYAKWLLTHFDLAPKGTLGGLVSEIAKHARHGGAKAEV
jgi:hypothetical protein